MGADVHTIRGMRQELAKVAGVTHPSIVAPPAPGGDGKVMAPTPAKPVTSKQLVGKVVSKTNLQKTNYTMPQVSVPSPDISQTSEQKALAPPAVRS